MQAAQRMRHVWNCCANVVACLRADILSTTTPKGAFTAHVPQILLEVSCHGHVTSQSSVPVRLLASVHSFLGCRRMMHYSLNTFCTTRALVSCSDIAFVQPNLKTHTCYARSCTSIASLTLCTLLDCACVEWTSLLILNHTKGNNLGFAYCTHVKHLGLSGWVFGLRGC